MNRSRAAAPADAPRHPPAGDPDRQPAALFPADDEDGADGSAAAPFGPGPLGIPALDGPPPPFAPVRAGPPNPPHAAALPGINPVTGPLAGTSPPATTTHAAPAGTPPVAAPGTEATAAMPVPAQLGSVAVFAPNHAGAWDDGQAGQFGTDNYFSGSDAYAEQNGPSFRIAFASFDAVQIENLVTEEMKAGDAVSVDVSYTIKNSAGVAHTDTLQDSDFALGPQEWIEKIPDDRNSSPDDPNGYLNPAQDGLNVPAGDKAVLGSAGYSFSSGTGSIGVDTDVTAAVQQAAAAGRNLVLGLSVTTIADPYDDVPQDYLENPRITVTAIPPGPKPTISYTEADQHLQAGSSDLPFGSVTRGDPTGGGGDTIGITILDAYGDGTDADGGLVATDGGTLHDDGPGQYFLDSAGSLMTLQTELDGLQFTAAATAAGQTATFELDLQSADGSTTDNQNTSVIIDEACFAQGTLLATPNGERPVERLGTGDVVETAGGPRAVVWRGYRTVDVGRLPDPEDHWLVRIRAGAFADAVPRRDLWVTGEHCLLVEGGLIPARMLVNGGSIDRDRTRRRYTYHHIELERHGILFAEGLAAESYLDTGNRGAFANAATVALHPQLQPELHPQRAAGAPPAHRPPEPAAPLVTDRARVEPVWRRLAERARAMGRMPGPVVAGTPPATGSGLRLALANGAELAAASWTGTRAVFHLPPGACPVRLLSPAARPSEVVGPFLDDRRRLGIAIRQLLLRRDDAAAPVRLPAAMLSGAGWHALEGDVRWTDGAAALELPVANGPVELELHVAAAMACAPDTPDAPDAPAAVEAA